MGEAAAVKIRIPLDDAVLPPGLKEQLRREGNVIRFPVSFSAPEKKVLKSSPWMWPSEFARKNRMMTLGRFAGLPWQGHLTPYLDGIMDAAAFPSVQELVLLKCVQGGGTECAHNVVAWSIEYLKSPVMYIYPDINTGRENAQDRIIEMIRKSRALSKYFTGAEDDVTKFRIKLSHMPIYVGWATSPARLANKPIRIMIYDEPELYPDTAGKKHADPVSEGNKRTTTYGDARKIFYISVPSVDTGFMWTKFNSVQCRFDYYVICPDCAAEQVMTFENIKWPRIESSTGKWTDPDDVPEGEAKSGFEHPDPDVLRSRKLAYYVCAHCGSRWDDRKRDTAAGSKLWRERETGMELFAYLEAHRPISMGFHQPAWFSFFVSLSDAAAAWVEYVKTRDKNKLKDFLTKFAAEPWTQLEAKREPSAILRLRDDRPQGAVPGGNRVAAVLMVIDTQDDGFWYEIRAIGYGMTEDSWQVRFGWVDSFAALDVLLLQSEYFDPDKKAYRIKKAAIDTGGHRAAEVFEWCRLRRGQAIPIKGADRQQAHLKWFAQEYYPGTNKQIPGGMKRLDIDVNYYKDKLAGKLEIDPGDPGAWHLCAECSEEWARQMTSEAIDEKTGRWVPIYAGRPNHAWDLGAYALALADALFIKNWKKDGGAQEKPRSGEGSPLASTGSDWIRRPGPGKSGGWVGRW